MVQMQDAAVLLTGAVIAAEDTTNYETGALTGAQFTIAAPGGGFALLRLTNEDMNILGRSGSAPRVGSNVALLARPSSWSREGGAGNVRYRFVRIATVADLDAAGVALADAEKVAA